MFKKLSAYEQDQADKLKQLQRRIFRETIKARIKHGAKKQYRAPFMPTDANPHEIHTALSSSLELQSSPSAKITSSSSSSAVKGKKKYGMAGESLKSTGFADDANHNAPVMFDAETGEPLKFTTSTWNGLEGKVNLSPKSILERGTGKIDVLHASGISTKQNYRARESNPLVSFLEESGPLNVRMHKDWDAKTDQVVRLPPISARDSPPVPPQAGLTSDALSVHSKSSHHSSHHSKGSSDKRSRSRASESDMSDSDSDTESDVFSLPNDIHMQQAAKMALMLDTSLIDAFDTYRSRTNSPSALSTDSYLVTGRHPPPPQTSRSGMHTGRSGALTSRNNVLHNQLANIAVRYAPIHLSNTHYSKFEFGTIQPCPNLFAAFWNLGWANSTANWKKLEDRYFNEIVDTITQMEKNKSLTHEPALVNKSKNESVRQVCRRLA
jgi:hypothetical protein